VGEEYGHPGAEHEGRDEVDELSDETDVGGGCVRFLHGTARGGEDGRELSLRESGLDHRLDFRRQEGRDLFKSVLQSGPIHEVGGQKMESCGQGTVEGEGGFDEDGFRGASGFLCEFEEEKELPGPIPTSCGQGGEPGDDPRGGRDGDQRDEREDDRDGQFDGVRKGHGKSSLPEAAEEIDPLDDGGEDGDEVDEEDDADADEGDGHDAVDEEVEAMFGPVPVMARSAAEAFVQAVAAGEHEPTEERRDGPRRGLGFHDFREL
jgi:hypothetical protein